MTNQELSFLNYHSLELLLQIIPPLLKQDSELAARLTKLVLEQQAMYEEQAKTHAEEQKHQANFK
jgi:hypothetical protein